MIEDPLDPRLRDAAAEYNKPPETPRDAMWAAIAAARGTRARRPIWKTLAWGGMAAAAVLLLGILIGRGLMSRNQAPVPPQVANQPVQDTATGDNAFKVAAVQYLSQSEVFLTTFRTDLKQGTLDQSAGRRAQDLLSSNRLLMDSPAARDPKTKALLQDLELVLAEIAQMTDQSNQNEANMIDEGLEQGGLLSRLRTAVPAGQPTVGL
ncbi:MAG: hypothetical protein ABI836_07435 [Gemmatimonadota bacterium]